MKKSKILTKTLALMAAVAMTAGCVAGCGSSEQKANSQTTTTANSENNGTEALKNADNSQYSDTITLVWYPNESAEVYTAARDEVARLIEEVTGKKVEQKLTTDYAIAIEAIANGTAQIGCNFGAEGYIQAKNSNDAVDVLLVNSGKSGTLDDAMYYSFFAVMEENAAEYADGTSYSIENIAGKKMSFVSNSSTSGFKVPTNTIIAKFSADSKWANLTVDDLLEGGSDKLFSEVLFGGSHQGSAYNLLSGKSDVSAFCDLELEPYAVCVEGEEAQAGCVYEIIKGAEAPFDTVVGARYTIISSKPVMNGPYVYNSDTISPEDVEAIQKLFTSDEVTNNPLIFYTEGSDTVGIYKKSGDNCFVTVEDEWYDPIRNMK